MTRKHRRLILAGTAAVWCLSVLISETFRLWRVFSGPPDLEEYVTHWDFQLIASAFLMFTKWLPLLAGLLLLEMIAFWLLAAARGRGRLPE